MPEGVFSTTGSSPDKSAIEAEIADLSRKIEEKRRSLEGQRNIIEEKEIVRQTVGERIFPTTFSSGGNITATVSAGTSAPGPSYLDSMGEESAELVRHLVGVVFDKGFDEAIKEASLMEPFIIDAFHDALVDRLYDELKNRGLIK